jgi:hypothetical protein
MAPMLMSAQRVSKDGGFYVCTRLILALCMLFFNQDLVLAQVSDVACSNTPAELLVRFPAEIADWAKLECSPIEQRMGAGDGWIWRHFPSRVPGSISSSPGARFVRVSYEGMRDDKNRLINQFPNFAISKKLKERQIFLLTAKTDSPSENRFLVIWPEPFMAYMYDLAKLPAEETIVVTNRNELRKRTERLRQGEKN